MPSLNFNISVTGFGISIAKNFTRTADGGSAVEIAVPKGFTGTLSTRTDDDTGTLTMASGHGIETGMIIDLYWEGGARYGITVGTVSVNSVPIGADNSGTGDVLPTATTAIVASERIPFNAAIDGDELEMIAMMMHYAVTNETAISHVILVDTGEAVIEELDLTATVPRAFDITGGDPNGFTGNPITDGFVSNASATNDATLRMLWVQDATP